MSVNLEHLVKARIALNEAVAALIQYGLLGFLMGAVLGTVALALLYGVGYAAYTFGYRLINPVGYWTEEVESAERRLTGRMEALDQCGASVEADQGKAPERLTTLLKLYPQIKRPRLVAGAF